MHLPRNTPNYGQDMQYKNVGSMETQLAQKDYDQF